MVASPEKKQLYCKKEAKKVIRFPLLSRAYKTRKKWFKKIEFDYFT